MTYEEAIIYLKKSLIYQMSLGSKELFHSNVWAWLIEQDNDFIKVFKPDINLSEYDSVEVWREYRHRDLTIWFKNGDKKAGYIVIENKIKALPSYEQLNEYTTDLDGYKLSDAVLTGIGDCVLDLSCVKRYGDETIWNYLDYEIIADNIYRIAEESYSEIIKTHIEQIEEYCLIIKCIKLILSESLKKAFEKYDYEINHRDLRDIRLLDVFKKLKGSYFLSAFKRSATYKELLMLENNSYKLGISQSFNNGKTTIDIKYQKGNFEDAGYEAIGIQLEEYQFRIRAERNSKKENISPEDIYNIYKDSWFDDSFDKESNRFIFNNKTTMRQKYCSYSGCFVYQYFNIQKDTSYEELFSKIKEYMIKASLIIGSNICIK